MNQKRKFDFIVLSLFFVFSVWLFGKSFGYEHGEFRIARHQVGDFGLHLSLIRSFSWGDNFPPESPFYPGEPLPYHYGVDLVVGILERFGVRIDYALNGVSALSLTALLYLIYRLTLILFGENRLRALLSVIFFLFSSNLTYVDFLKGKVFKLSLFKEIWRLPDYVYKGPYDSSIISIFSSLNPFLNQRHLIVGLTISLFIISYILTKKRCSLASLILLGALVGISTRIHSLVAASTLGVVIVLLGQIGQIVPFLTSAFLFALPHLAVVSSRAIPFQFISTYALSYWWQNAGFMLIFVPLGAYFSKKNQRRIFFSFFALFLIANFIQLSYRVEHNYSVIALFMIVANMFAANAIVRLPKIGMILCLFLLTASGFLNLMVVKNDYQYKVADSPKDRLITWIKDNTDKDAVFLAPQNLYDPVTLAGRKNYFGATYYSEVMGYDVKTRRAEVETGNIEGVDYLLAKEEKEYMNLVFTNNTYWVYRL